jgi:hypothetical protein
MTRVLLKILFGVMLLTTGKLHAQSQAEAEQQMKYYLERIQYWRYQYAPGDSGVSLDARPKDSVIVMSKMLANYIAEHPTTMRMSFKTLDDDGLKIISSADKKLRIYTWDMETGHEEHEYSGVYQFETAKGIKAHVWESNNGIVSDIFIVNGDKKYYLTVISAILSAKDAMKAVDEYVIEGDELTSATIIPTPGIKYTYDYSANFDYKKMKEDYVIKFDKQRLYVPTPDHEGKLNGWNVYKFNGEKFELEK